jgi:hypothetical protein
MAIILVNDLPVVFGVVATAFSGAVVNVCMSNTKRKTNGLPEQFHRYFKLELSLDVVDLFDWIHSDFATHRP